MTKNTQTNNRMKEEAIKARSAELRDDAIAEETPRNPKFTVVDLDEKSRTEKAKGFYGRHKRKFKIAGYTIAGIAVVGAAAYICHRTGAHRALLRGSADVAVAATEELSSTT